MSASTPHPRIGPAAGGKSPILIPTCTVPMTLSFSWDSLDVADKLP